MRFRFAFLIVIALFASPAWIVRPAAAQDSSSVSQTNSSAPEKTAATRNLKVDDYFRILEVEDAHISPEGKWVCYTVTTHDLKEDKDKTRIWMISTSGGPPIPLTTETVSSEHARWSPDGKYLAFLSGRGGTKSDKENEDKKKEIWILNREGGEAQKLTETIQDVDAYAWSPSGDRIVLELQDPSINELEAAKDKDKADAKPKAHPWVIDRLHFKEDEIGYLDRRRKHLYVYELASHKTTQITSGDYDDSAPAWSPDGSSIAFVSNRSDFEDPDHNYNTDIWTVAADNSDKGKSVVHVTTHPGTEGAPAWSPDGKWIAFTIQLEAKLYQYATFRIAVAPATGGEMKVLTQQLDRNASEPRFSPDGKWIYFIADDDGTQNLMRVPAMGGEITRPIGGRRMVESYSLGKDGAAVAVIGELTHPNEIYFLPVDGGDLRRLTTTNDALMAQIRLPHVEYVHFKSKDGTNVAGYLYEPPDYTPGTRYPTILRPHGGPVLRPTDMWC
jgi:dipeptidyl aminopeptidase/acylaminoacyl peptidase